jgi:heptosyltransferase I
MRLLFVRQDKLGDCLLACSTLSSLRTALPNSTLGVYCQPSMADIFARHPGRLQIETGPYQPKGWQIIRQGLKWRREGWEAVVLPKEDSGGLALSAKLAGIPVRVGLTGKWHGRALSHNFHGRLDPSLHEIRLMNRMAESATGLTLSEAPIPFPPSHEETAAAEGLVDGLGAYGVICPFTGGTSPQWPEQSFLALGGRIGSEWGMTTLVAGGPDQAERAERLATFAGGVSVAGAATLGGLGAIFSRAAFVVSVNSGLIHLAASQRTPVCVIETREDHLTASMRWAPWMTQVATASPRDGKSPDVDEVWTLLSRLTQRGGAERDASWYSGEPS